MKSEANPLMKKAFSLKGRGPCPLAFFWDKLKSTLCLFGPKEVKWEGKAKMCIRDSIYCMRGGFPMVLGMGEGESLCATDTLAILPYTKNVISMALSLIHI